MRQLLITGAAAACVALTGCSIPGVSVESNPLGGGLPQATVQREVTYRVTGDGQASITWMTVDAGAVGQESATGQALPFEQRELFDEGIGLSYTALNVVAVGNESTTSIGCEILVDGEQVASQQSTGAFATVTCSVSG